MNNFISKYFNNLMKNKAKAALSFSTIFSLSSAAYQTMIGSIKWAGWYIVELILCNKYVIIFCIYLFSSVIFSFLPKKTAKSRGISWAAVVIFVVALLSFRPAANEVKLHLNLPEFYYAERFFDGDFGLEKLYEILKIKDKRHKNDLICTLIKGRKMSYRSLMYAVIGDLSGYVYSDIDEKRVTECAIIYGDPNLVQFLESRGVIKISKQKIYKPYWLYSLFQSKKKDLDIFEFALSCGRKDIHDRLLDIFKSRN